MKIILSIYLLLLVCAVSSCRDKTNNFPIYTELGERTIAGYVDQAPNPCVTKPCLPGAVLALNADADQGEYVLSLNSQWIWDEAFTVDDNEYSIDDTVEITGIVSRVQIDETEEYLELEIERITELSETGDV